LRKKKLINIEVHQAKNAEVPQAKLVKFLYLYKNNLEKSEKKFGIKTLSTKKRRSTSSKIGKVSLPIFSQDCFQISGKTTGR